MAYGNEGGENVRFKLYIYEIKIYIHYYNSFALQRSFLKLQISHL
jgi:hypothetical protein